MAQSRGQAALPLEQQALAIALGFAPAPSKSTPRPAPGRQPTAAESHRTPAAGASGRAVSKPPNPSRGGTTAAADVALLDAVTAAVVSAPPTAWPLISKTLGMRPSPSVGEPITAESAPASRPAVPSGRARRNGALPLPAGIIDWKDPPSQRAGQSADGHLPPTAPQAASAAAHDSAPGSASRNSARGDVGSMILGPADAAWLRREDEPWQDQFALAFGAAAGAAASVAHRVRPALRPRRPGSAAAVGGGGHGLRCGPGDSTDTAAPSDASAEAVARATSAVLAELLSDADVIVQVRDAVRERLRACCADVSLERDARRVPPPSQLAAVTREGALPDRELSKTFPDMMALRGDEDRSAGRAGSPAGSGVADDDNSGSGSDGDVGGRAGSTHEVSFHHDWHEDEAHGGGAGDDAGGGSGGGGTALDLL